MARAFMWNPRVAGIRDCSDPIGNAVERFTSTLAGFTPRSSSAFPQILQMGLCTTSPEFPCKPRRICTAGDLVAGDLVVVPSMFDSSKLKPFSQPDGGEVIAKRKGVVARRGLREA